jgi:hypothetical protein
MSATHWKPMPKLLGLRRRVEVAPGWPQAFVTFRCGHSIARPTWHNGKTTPKPRPFYRCHECIRAWENVNWFATPQPLPPTP